MELASLAIFSVNTAMRKIIISFFLFAIPSAFLKAQDENKVFQKVEVDAHTNKKQWAEHIMRNAQIPDSILRDIPAGIYKVTVQFVVDIHGNLGQVKAKNDPGYGLAQRAINVISSYKGKWQPANQCGRNVKAYREEPIVFAISHQ